MFKATIVGITQKLDSVFECPVYIDSVDQDLNTPCFIINIVRLSQDIGLSNIYLHRQSFDICYFPETKKPTIEFTEVIENLRYHLEYINVKDGLVRATDISYETVDGVLHFLVNYDLRVRKVIEPAPYMNKLAQSQGVK